MRNTRPSKRQTLLTAVLYTAATLMWIYYALHIYQNIDSYTPLTQACTGGILVIGTVASIFNWHRWFTYDKQ